MAEAVEKAEPEAEDKVEPEAEDKVDDTSFAFSWLVSRLAGTLPRLVGTVEVDNKIDPDAFPLLFFSDCVPPCFTRSLSCTLLSPTSGANSKSNSENRLAVDTGAFSITTFGLQDLAGATL